MFCWFYQKALNTPNINFSSVHFYQTTLKTPQGFVSKPQIFTFVLMVLSSSSQNPTRIYMKNTKFLIIIVMSACISQNPTSVHLNIPNTYIYSDGFIRQLSKPHKCPSQNPKYLLLFCWLVRKLSKPHKCPSYNLVYLLLFRQFSKSQNCL